MYPISPRQHGPHGMTFRLMPSDHGLRAYIGLCARHIAPGHAAACAHDDFSPALTHTCASKHAWSPHISYRRCQAQAPRSRIGFFHDYAGEKPCAHYGEHVDFVGRVFTFELPPKQCAPDYYGLYLPHQMMRQKPLLSVRISARCTNEVSPMIISAR